METEDRYYKMLDISKKATDEEIEAKYIMLRKMYHPDKNDSRTKDLPRDVKLKQYEKAKLAFDKIMELRKGVNYPDYVKEYEIRDEFNIQRNKKLEENFSFDKFNEEYAKSKERDKKNGIESAFDRGYEKFDNRNYNINEKISTGSYTYNFNDLNIDYSKNDAEEEEIIEKHPEYFNSTLGSNNFEELGLNNISDFSSGSGVDLTVAYTNKKFWGDTAIKNDFIRGKYGDQSKQGWKESNFESKLNERMSSMMAERSDTSIFNIPTKTEAEESIFEMARKSKEENRNKNLEKINNYYSNINRGLID